MFRNFWWFLSINIKILWRKIFYYRQGSTLLLNESFAFNFLCESFQPKLIIFFIQIINGFFIFYNVAWDAFDKKLSENLSIFFFWWRFWKCFFDIWKIPGASIAPDDPAKLKLRTKKSKTRKLNLTLFPHELWFCNKKRKVVLNCLPFRFFF